MSLKNLVFLPWVLLGTVLSASDWDPGVESVIKAFKEGKESVVDLLRYPMYNRDSYPFLVAQNKAEMLDNFEYLFDRDYVGSIEYEKL